MLQLSICRLKCEPSCFPHPLHCFCRCRSLTTKEKSHRELVVYKVMHTFVGDQNNTLNFSLTPDFIHATGIQVALKIVTAHRIPTLRTVFRKMAIVLHYRDSSKLGIHWSEANDLTFSFLTDVTIVTTFLELLCIVLDSVESLLFDWVLAFTLFMQTMPVTRSSSNSSDNIVLCFLQLSRFFGHLQTFDHVLI